MRRRSFVEVGGEGEGGILPGVCQAGRIRSLMGGSSYIVGISYIYTHINYLTLMM